VLLILGLISIPIFSGFITYQNRKNLRNIQKFIRKRLTSSKVSLLIFTNTFFIIIYELLVAILLVVNQSVFSVILLLGVHTLGLILGFIVLDTDLRLSKHFQE